MKVTDVIKKRKSIRSYNGIALDSRSKQEITDYIAGLSQPWRVLVVGNDIYFYYQEKSQWSELDMGIALCHFELTCKEEGIKGKYVIMEDIPSTADLKYLISWKSDS